MSFNSGKIRYYTIPPEDEHDPHISSAIVQQMATEFDISSYEAMETDTLNAGLTQNLMAKGVVIQSTGPVEAEDESGEKMEEDIGDASGGIVCIVVINFNLFLT
jgi:nuclear GTP-binding protein